MGSPNPSQLKHLVWRAINGFLAVKGELKRRHLIDNGLCPICNASEETLCHAIFDYSYTKDVWTSSNFFQVLADAPNSYFSDKVVWMINCGVKVLWNYWVWPGFVGQLEIQLS